MITNLPVADLESASRGVHIRDDQVDHLVHLFKLLADDTRMRILLFLSRKREMHVRALCKQLNQSQPAVSHHLALLRVAGLISMRRQGRHNYYRLMPRRFRHMLKLFRSVVRTRGAEVETNGQRMEYVSV